MNNEEVEIEINVYNWDGSSKVTTILRSLGYYHNCLFSGRKEDIFVIAKKLYEAGLAIYIPPCYPHSVIIYVALHSFRSR